MHEYKKQNCDLNLMNLDNLIFITVIKAPLKKTTKKYPGVEHTDALMKIL